MDDKTNIDNKKSLNIDTNNIDNNRYALKGSFVPRTEETLTAKDIASALNDLANYALYRSAVQDLGVGKALELLHETKDDIRLGEQKGKPIKHPGALYNWKVQKEKARKVRK